MKKTVLLLPAVMALSLSATTQKTTVDFSKYLSDEAVAATFWCKFCKKDVDQRQAVDYKEHLAAAHFRCGTCEIECGSKPAVRFHEADHVGAHMIKKQ